MRVCVCVCVTVFLREHGENSRAARYVGGVFESQKPADYDENRFLPPLTFAIWFAIIVVIPFRPLVMGVFFFCRKTIPY